MSPDAIHIESASDTDGRTLTGVDVPEHDLTATVEALGTRSEPDAKPDRAPNGQFQPGQKPERQSRGSKRFEQLDNEAKAAREEAAQAKRERDDLKAKLEAQKVPDKA